MIKYFYSELIYWLFSSFIIRRCEDKNYYLTFDDGPHPIVTPKILSILRQYDVKATFFVVGEMMSKHPQIVDQVLSEGHTLGWHSNSHKSNKKMKASELKYDLACFKQFEKKHSFQSNLYRPPYGDLTVTTALQLIFKKWKIIMWSLDSRDSFDSQEKVMRNLSNNNLRGGEIILFHDDYEETVKILNSFLLQLKDKGLKCNSF